MKPITPATDLLYRIATGGARLRRRLTPIVGTLFIVLVAGFVAAGVGLDRLLRLAPLLLPPLTNVVGTPLLAAGAAIVFWCNISFHRAKGTPVPFNPPQALVTSGPYALVRNPMIAGLFMVMFGAGILLGSRGATLITVPLFILLHVLELKLVEEPELERRLGEPYRQYKRVTPMFVPRLRRGSRTG